MALLVICVNGRFDDDKFTDLVSDAMVGYTRLTGKPAITVEPGFDAAAAVREGRDDGFDAVKEASDIELETSIAKADEVIEQGIEKGKICLEEERDKHVCEVCGGDAPLDSDLCDACFHDDDGEWWATQLLRRRQKDGQLAVVTGWK